MKTILEIQCILIEECIRKLVSYVDFTRPHEFGHAEIEKDGSVCFTITDVDTVYSEILKQNSKLVEENFDLVREKLGFILLNPSNYGCISNLGLLDEDNVDQYKASLQRYTLFRLESFSCDKKKINFSFKRADDNFEINIHDKEIDCDTQLYL